MPKVFRTLAILVFSLLLSVPYSDSQNGLSTQPESDRLSVLARLIRTLYPDLTATSGGLLTMELDFDGAALYTSNTDVRFYPCRHSGVSLEASPIPYCGQIDRDKPTLAMNLGFGAQKNQPIFDLHVSGISVNGHLLSVREQFKNRVFSASNGRDRERYWTETDAIDALNAEHPKYGAGQKKEFLADLPVQAISQITGCRLNPDTAVFVAHLSGSPADFPPSLEWRVSGLYTALDNLKEGCIATFEPFSGLLTSYSGSIAL